MKTEQTIRLCITIGLGALWFFLSVWISNEIKIDDKAANALVSFLAPPSLVSALIIIILIFIEMVTRLFDWIKYGND